VEEASAVGRHLRCGQQPDRPFNGKILVRTEPELHRKAALYAAVEGVSLSRWISRQIESAR
jgi:predicted HicB family RNase H-like nuclease